MTVSTEYKGKYLHLMNDKTWEYVERVNCNGAVLILAVNNENKLILVEQYRAALKKNIIELPAGLVADQGEEESVEVAAIRELEEEAGYQADSVSTLNYGPTAPGLTNEMITIVQAHNLIKVSEGGGVDNEKITVHEVPLEKVDEWLKEKEKSGNLIDVKIFTGLYHLKKW